ncbi:MAG: bifunctional DNA primase/helicase [Petrimonas sp.]|jgi:predicted transcriptional regulator/5S rRNA maturation endonuclease (ribonuclease M5)
MKEEILERTDRGLHVFNFYMPFEFKLKKNFRNPLYDDSKPSCNIYFDNRSNCYKMHDFGNIDFSGDCFWFAATVNHLDVKRNFPEVLQRINDDLCLNIEQPSLKHKQSKLSTLKQTQPFTIKEQEPTLPFKTIEKPFSEQELSFWKEYGISQKELNRYKVKSLTSYKSKNREGAPFQLETSRTEPIFAYFGNDYVKLYRPYSKMRFLYGGQMPEIYCFGLEQLPQRGDVVFITGGEKDVLCLSAHGFNAVCFNSETASIGNEMIEMLARRFRHVIFLYDMDETGKRESTRQCEIFSAYKTIRMELPLLGTKQEKDISDYFRMGNTADDFKKLISDSLEKIYTQTIMMLNSCEIDYNNPPDRSQTVVSVNDVPLGTYDNLFCITGGEGTGKSNYVSAIIAGTLPNADPAHIPDLLGLDVCPNTQNKVVLHYDTEQSEYQLHKNIGKTLRRAGIDYMPEFYRPVFLAALSRKERLQLIKDSMDLYHHRFNGIHLVVIDGIADLIRSANDETESVAIVDELYRLAGIYNTCILCVLHFVPNGIKLRGHIGSELQRKAAAILSIEKDENPALSVVKALKVRDGSPLDVPMMLFGWDKEKDMHVYRGEKSQEDKEKRKFVELTQIAKEVFRLQERLSYNELVTEIMQAVGVKDRTAKSYISYMRNNEIIAQDNNNFYFIKP